MDEPFRREFLGEFASTAHRCEVKAPRQDGPMQCPDAAEFTVHIPDTDRDSLVCGRCLIAFLRPLIKRYEAVVVTAVRGPRARSIAMPPH